MYELNPKSDANECRRNPGNENVNANQGGTSFEASFLFRSVLIELNRSEFGANQSASLVCGLANERLIYSAPLRIV